MLLFLCVCMVNVDIMVNLLNLWWILIWPNKDDRMNMTEILWTLPTLQQWQTLFIEHDQKIINIMTMTNSNLLFVIVDCTSMSFKFNVCHCHGLVKLNIKVCHCKKIMFWKYIFGSCLFFIFYFFIFFLFHGDSISRLLAPLADEYAHKTTAPHLVMFIVNFRHCKFFGHVQL